MVEPAETTVPPVTTPPVAQDAPTPGVVTDPAAVAPTPGIEPVIPPADGGQTTSPIFDFFQNTLDAIRTAHENASTSTHDTLFQRWTGIDPSVYKPDEYWYVVLILLLFILPQLFTRFRIPSAITTLGLGVVSGMVLGFFHHDNTIDLLALFGIVSLFLFAGMEVDFRELKQHKKVLIVHMLICMAALSGVAWAIVSYFAIPVQPALIIALALLTPSTGFILSSLRSFGLSSQEAFQVKINAIASELLALIVLFFCVQSGDLKTLGIASAAVVGLVIALPIALWFYARFIAKYAPNSEFAFVLILAILASWATKTLGAYYLLGAFITGVVAMRMRKVVPSLESKEVLHSIELFASFFIPFYFFHAGVDLNAKFFSYEALIWGGIFLGLALPLRLLYVVGHRLPLAGESFLISNRIAVTMLPTLVFTLVLSGLLRDLYPDIVKQFPYIVGGLIIYTLTNTLLPGLILSRGSQQMEFEHIHLTERFGHDEEQPIKKKEKTLSAPAVPSVALEPKSKTDMAVDPPDEHPPAPMDPKSP